MKLFLSLIVMALLATPVFAQNRVDPNKPDAELTKDEAEIRLNEWRSKVASLESQLTQVNNNTQSLEAKLTQLSNDLADCNKAIYDLVGATEADVNNFRERLGRIENRVNEMKRMSDADLSKRKGEIDQLEKDLNALRTERIALLPEFYNKIIKVAGDIRDLRERANRARGNTYTVGTWAKDKDCLWNIAAKSDIYSDPFMWPKIWQANTDQIRNPDLIFPGQKLEIPAAGPKTDEELRAERLYYRQKREAARRRAAARRSRVQQEEAGSGN